MIARIRLLVLMFMILFSAGNSPAADNQAMRELLWTAVEDVLLREAPETVSKVRFLGAGSWLAGTATSTSDIDITLGLPDRKKERELVERINDRIINLAKERNYSSGQIENIRNKINVFGHFTTSGQDRYRGQTGKTFIHWYARETGGSSSAFRFEMQDGTLRRQSIAPEIFWNDLEGKVPNRFKQAWAFIEDSVLFLPSGTRDPFTSATKTAKYLDRYERFLKPGIEKQWNGGRELRQLSMSQELRRKMEVLVNLKKNHRETDLARYLNLGAQGAQQWEEVYKAFGVAQGDRAGLRKAMEEFGQAGRNYLMNMRDQAEAIETLARTGHLLDSSAKAGRILSLWNRVKTFIQHSGLGKALGTTLGTSMMAADAYSVINAYIKDGSEKAALTAFTVLTSYGIPPVAISQMLKDAGETSVTWAGNYFIFSPINDMALTNIYSPGSDSSCNIFTSPASPFAQQRVSRETLAYKFKSEEAVKLAARLFLERSKGICGKFTTAGTGSLVPRLQSLAVQDWKRSKAIMEKVTDLKAMLGVAGMYTPVTESLELYVDGTRLERRHPNRQFSKLADAEGRARFTLVSLVHFALRRGLPFPHEDLVEIWGRGGSQALSNYIRTHVVSQGYRGGYLSDQKLTIRITLLRGKGWQVHGPREIDLERPGTSASLQIDLTNPEPENPSHLFTEDILLAAGSNADPQAVVQCEVAIPESLDWLDNRIAPARNARFVLTAKRQRLGFLLVKAISGENNAPLPGTMVRVENPTFNAAGLTGRNGVVKIVGLVPGDYQLSASREGFQPYLRPILHVAAPSDEATSWGIRGRITLQPRREAEKKEVALQRIREQPAGTRAAELDHLCKCFFQDTWDKHHYIDRSNQKRYSKVEYQDERIVIAPYYDPQKKRCVGRWESTIVYWDLGGAWKYPSVFDWKTTRANNPPKSCSSETVRFQGKIMDWKKARDLGW